jgi:hypothetical protein
MLILQLKMQRWRPLVDPSRFRWFIAFIYMGTNYGPVGR